MVFFNILQNLRSGFGDITPTPPPPAQPELGNDAANSTEQNTQVQTQPSVQRSRTPTPSLEVKTSTAPLAAIQESNQTSPSTTSEPTALPLVVGQNQPANNNSVQTPKSESQGKGKATST